MGFFAKLFGRRHSYDELDRHVIVYQDEINGRNIERIGPVIGIACRVMEATKRYYLWSMTISGYEDDPRPLVQIPEVRAWCKAVHEKHGPMFAALLDEPTLRWYLASVYDVDIIEMQSGNYTYSFKSPELVEFAKATILRSTVLCGMYKVDSVEMRRVHRDATTRLHQTTGLPLELLQRDG
jgi:hypothetical protein